MSDPKTAVGKRLLAKFGPWPELERGILRLEDQFVAMRTARDAAIEEANRLRVAAPSPALTREALRLLQAKGWPEDVARDILATVSSDCDELRTAATILLSTIRVVMPEHSPYGCPHSRDWLLALLDDVAAALSKIPPPTEEAK